MCGIAGIVADRAELLEPIVRMTRALRHRGPDDEGLLLARPGSAPLSPLRGTETKARPDLPLVNVSRSRDDRVALGHRRLSIIDLSPAGWQPMTSADSQTVLVYNGEIYNYVELREELRALGHRFGTDSDTEVLLAAWREWGPRALTHLNGMFAFAIYDAVAGRLFCARDRFGVKPFYYHSSDGFLAFASEIKALAHHPKIPFTPHDGRLAGFLADGLLDEGSGTFFEGICSLPGGHTLDYDTATGRMIVSRWYELPSPKESRDMGAAEFRALLQDSVRLRLRSDVDVGTCLSGGLDSSAIVALTAALRPADSAGLRHSFSIVYGDKGLEEASYVDAVVARTGVVSHRLTPTARDFASDFERFVAAQDEPVPSLGMYSQYSVMKLAREAGIKVLLDGQGADEALAGYHYQFGPFLAEQLRARGLSPAFREARELNRVTGRSLPFLAALALYHSVSWPEGVVRWSRRRFRTHASLDASFLAPEFATRPDVRSVRHLPSSSLQRERHRDLTLTSIPALLRYEDRSSMAFGIEARLPFLDYRLVEAAMALPATTLIKNGYTKHLLRDAMTSLLPSEVCWRKDKLGFPTPETRFLAESGEFVRSLLEDSRDLGGRLRRGAVKALCSRDDQALSRTPGLVRLLSTCVWLARTRERVTAEAA